MSRVLAEETQYQEYECSTTESDSSGPKTHARITAVYLDYILFMENAVEDSPSSSRPDSQPSPNQLWTKIVPKPPPAPWMQDLKDCSWNSFQMGVIAHLGPTEQYFSDFLTQVNDAHLLHWIAMISGNGTYGIRKAIEITSANAFKAFTTEAIRVYPSKVIFRLEMKDPREIVKNQTHSLLSMHFGPPAVRAALQRSQRRQLNNKKADIGDERVHQVVPALQESIRKNSSGGRSEYPVFVNPDNPLMTMRILHKELWAWATAIVDEVEGVDLTHPPHGPKYPTFVWGSRKVPLAPPIPAEPTNSSAVLHSTVASAPPKTSGQSRLARMFNADSSPAPPMPAEPTGSSAPSHPKGASAPEKPTSQSRLPRMFNTGRCNFTRHMSCKPDSL
ncbi:hypothetical protein PGT21_028779 [Puccinia graminis f. sp. tritici]|uniref:Uncharacterized protein n=1 Tax=Puccinia graminis f. sp. tritici TaxID=56615 RepID=A0A5B0P1H0_PUCGR|nr:hypothetical protein PGT21_028779 [Puccinia graminis f. sp. tritici]